LAVYLGSQAASVILGDSAPEHTRAPKTGVKGFVRKGLARWGPLVCLRAAIAAARLIVNDSDELPEEARRLYVHLAEEYAIEQRQALLDRLRGLPRLPLPSAKKWQAHWWAGYGCMCTLATQTGGSPAWKAKDTVESVSKAVGGDAPVRAAVVAELLPWALGYSDPVRERVEAREAREATSED